LISFSDNLLLAYSNAVDFFVLISYPTTLLNLFISSSSFLVESLWFSIYDAIHVIYISDSLTSCFPVWVLCISFSCLIALARASSTMLKKSGEGGHLCLGPVL
jgi:hypothetical protein